ncbi:signalosome subunit 1 [Gorgonomyces haynaldii]|nr:signalosome subunit 1 [Gorgonomyces haynaldii]
MMDISTEEISEISKKRKQMVMEPHIDLDQYMSNYTGSKTQRLLFMADVCPSLRVDCLRMALNELKQSQNVVKYKQVGEMLNELVPTPLDDLWIEQTHRQNVAKTQKLESELKTYKNNLIKESIRMGLNDLGDHFLSIGDVQQALQCYNKTREYCTTPKHVIDMCLNTIKCSMDLQNYVQVSTNVLKIESTPEIPEKQAIVSKLVSVQALVDLKAGALKKAAKGFMDVQFEQFQSSDYLSQIDVAVYGGLCALATFDRQEMKKMLENHNFKQFLELEPQIRELVEAFYNCRYGVCMDIMAKIKEDLLLDMYLNELVDIIFQFIKKRAIVQYFGPYESVEMTKMAHAFNMTLEQLETYLLQLITENQIKARIDSHKKVLVAKQTNPRKESFKKALQVLEDFEDQYKIVLLRAKLHKQDLVVRSDHKHR